MLAPLKVWAVVLPLALVVLVIGVQYWWLDRLLPAFWSTVATAALLVFGVAVFASAIWRLLERAEARLRVAYAAERSQRRQLQALAAASVDLATELDMELVAQKIVDRSREVTGARYGALAVLAADLRIASFYSSGLDQETRARLGPPPEGHGLLGLVTREGRPLRLEDLTRHPAAVGFPPHHPEMRSLLAVPVWMQGEVIGNLYLCEKEDHSPFSDADEQTLERFAAQAAVAIQNARLHRRLQALSLVAERERIAMDLHDGVMQSLYGVRLQLEAAMDRLAEEAPVRGVVDQAIDRLGTVTADIRHYVFDLRARLADGDSIVDSLHQLLESLEAAPVFRCSLTVEGEQRPVPAGVRWELWHVVREALANAVRHSGGSHLDVSVRFSSEGLTLDVVDDGHGWDGRPGGPGHHGLANMRRRVEGCGGEIAWEAPPGGGTRVRVSLPAQRAYAAGTVEEEHASGTHG